MVKAAEIINKFAEFSGLQLNVHKTKAMEMGNNTDQENLPLELTDK